MRSPGGGPYGRRRRPELPVGQLRVVPYAGSSAGGRLPPGDSVRLAAGVTVSVAGLTVTGKYGPADTGQDGRTK